MVSVCVDDSDYPSNHSRCLVRCVLAAGSTVKNVGCVATGVRFTNVTGTAEAPGSLECLKTRPCERFVMDGVDVKYLDTRHVPWTCGYVAVAGAGAVEPALPASCKGHY